MKQNFPKLKEIIITCRDALLFKLEAMNENSKYDKTFPKSRFHANELSRNVQQGYQNNLKSAIFVKFVAFLVPFSC